jgi:hypothetical protein
MNKSVIKHQLNAPSFRQLAKLYIGSIVFSLALVGFAVALNRLPLNYLFIIGTLFGLVTFTGLAHRSVANYRRRAWSPLARRTGLTCEVGSALLSTPAQLIGHYGGRPVQVYHAGQGRFQPASTRVEITLENFANETLNLRGPLPAQGLDNDPVTSQMFNTAGYRQVGTDQRFMIRGPVHLTNNLLSGERMQEQLVDLTQPVSVELYRQKLILDHPDNLYDADYVGLLLEFSHLIADRIERKSRARSTLMFGASRL